MLVAVALLFWPPPSPYVFSVAGIVGMASVWPWLGLRVACDGGGMFCERINGCNESASDVRYLRVESSRNRWVQQADF